jgi:hypothetical protein
MSPAVSVVDSAICIVLMFPMLLGRGDESTVVQMHSGNGGRTRRPEMVLGWTRHHHPGRRISSITNFLDSEIHKRFGLPDTVVF